MCGPSGSPSMRLLDDLDRLVYLRQAHREAVVVVAHRADRDLEVEVLVGAVGVGLAQVPGVARGTEQRAGHAEPQQRRGVQRAGAAQALQHDLVRVQDRPVLVRPLGHHLQELAQLELEARGDVLDHAAHLEVARVHALPGGHLEQVEDQVALAQAVEEDRDAPRSSALVPSQIRCEAIRLSSRWITRRYCAALGHLDLHQLLDRAAEGHGVEVVGEVVHPLDHRDDLPVGLVLGRLLDSGVDVADDRFDVPHDLALERDEQPQHPVRGGVVGAEVERQELFARPGARRRADPRAGRA